MKGHIISLKFYFLLWNALLSVPFNFVRFSHTSARVILVSFFFRFLPKDTACQDLSLSWKSFRNGFFAVNANRGVVLFIDNTLDAAIAAIDLNVNREKKSNWDFNGTVRGESDNVKYSDNFVFFEVVEWLRGYSPNLVFRYRVTKYFNAW